MFISEATGIGVLERYRSSLGRFDLFRAPETVFAQWHQAIQYQQSTNVCLLFLSDIASKCCLSEADSTKTAELDVICVECHAAPHLSAP